MIPPNCPTITVMLLHCHKLLGITKGSSLLLCLHLCLPLPTYPLETGICPHPRTPLQDGEHSDCYCQLIEIGVIAIGMQPPYVIYGL